MSTESPSDDIVTRLRLYGTRTPDEAADRIEALEAERDAEAALVDQLAELLHRARNVVDAERWPGWERQASEALAGLRARRSVPVEETPK